MTYDAACHCHLSNLSFVFQLHQAKVKKPGTNTTAVRVTVLDAPGSTLVNGFQFGNVLFHFWIPHT